MIIRTKKIKKTIKGNLMCGYVFFSDRQNKLQKNFKFNFGFAKT